MAKYERSKEYKYIITDDIGDLFLIPAASRVDALKIFTDTLGEKFVEDHNFKIDKVAAEFKGNETIILYNENENKISGQ